VEPWTFGNTLRIAFVVTRMDRLKAQQLRTGRPYPVCRVALTTNRAVEPINQCQRLVGMLEKSGLLKKAEKAAAG
jgi:hypothetical protein